MSNQNSEKKISSFDLFPSSLLNFIKKNILKSKTTKTILSERKIHFIQEYLKLNKISISSTCSVKIENHYIYGHLTLFNSKLSINQYESNKLPKKENENSFNYNRTMCPLIVQKNDISSEDIFYPLFFIDFNLATCQLVIHKTKQKFRLIILGRNIKENDYENNDDYISKYRIVKFKMLDANPQKFQLVCESINKSIILSNGYRYNIFSINIRNNFCREYFMNFKEFAKKGNTGDIILFRGYAKESQLQRVFTNADYDHVGILVKKDGILQVYESTGKEGVKLRPWQEFITYLWYLLYEKMVYRPLIVSKETMQKYILKESEKNNENELIDFNLDNQKEIKKKFYDYLDKKVIYFINHTEDKKYTFSKKGFLCQSPMRKNTLNRKGFSCSELVAACYFHSGIITDELEASNYLPGAFSRSGNLAFNPGFSLGQEFIIDFSSSLK